MPGIHVIVSHLRLNIIILNLEVQLHSPIKNKNFRTNSLFIQENRDDDADDEDHGEDWAHHPYESVTSLYLKWFHLQLGSHHRVGVRAGSKRFLKQNDEKVNVLRFT